jgi:ankyrin repeat protein
MRAAYEGGSVRVSDLLSKGADPNASNGVGQTALMIAAAEGKQASN